MLQTSLEAIQRESFKWMSAQYNKTSKHVSDADITIARHLVSKRDNKDQTKYRFTITFRNAVQKRFGEYIDFAIAEDVIMLNSSSKEAGGFKFYGLNSKLNPTIQLQENEVTGCLNDFIGDYALKYDAKFKLYYIEKESVNDK